MSRKWGKSSQKSFQLPNIHPNFEVETKTNFYYEDALWAKLVKHLEFYIRANVQHFPQ